MAETVKVNLEKTLMSLKIIKLIVGGLTTVLVACFLAYANLHARISVMEERTRNTSDTVNRIYDIVIDWSPDGQKTSSTQKEKEIGSPKKG